MAEDDLLLRDLMKIGSVTDVASAFARLSEVIREQCEWIRVNVKRTDRSLALYNLLAAGRPYLELAKANLEGPIQPLALAGRSLLELDVQCARVQLGEPNLNEWMAEAPLDKIELLERILELHHRPESAQAASILREEIDRLEGLVKRISKGRKRFADMGELSEAVNLQEDHRTFYKFSSKIMHPTSYAVNSPKDIHGRDFWNITVIHIQLYALRLIARVARDLQIPEEVWDRGPGG